MRRPTDHSPAILSAAARLFGQKRFHEVLIDDIASSAGVGKGTIYRFYRTKEDILAAICLVSLDELTADLARLAAGPEEAAERLGRMIESLARHFRQRSDVIEVMQREWGRVVLARKSLFAMRRAKALSLFARVIRDGQAAGRLRALNAEAAADMLMGMSRNLIRFGDPRLTPAQVARMVLDVFLKGTAVSKVRRK